MVSIKIIVRNFFLAMLIILLFIVAPLTYPLKTWGFVMGMPMGGMPMGGMPMGGMPMGGMPMGGMPMGGFGGGGYAMGFGGGGYSMGFGGGGYGMGMSGGYMGGGGYMGNMGQLGYPGGGGSRMDVPGSLASSSLTAANGPLGSVKDIDLEHTDVDDPHGRSSNGSRFRDEEIDQEKSSVQGRDGGVAVEAI